MVVSRFLAFALLIAQSTAELLHPESELTHNCFNFPSSSFHRKNSIKATYGASPHAAGGLEVGEKAYDFTLSTLDGKDVTLSKLIKTKPVLLVWGMHTCPAFQGFPGEKFHKTGYEYEWELVEKYKDDVHFIHLVGPEPHPLNPDTNFDEGMFMVSYWSTVRQPKTYEDRLTMTSKIRDIVHPSAFLLADNLSSVEGAPNQGVWCTMGLGARTSTLIGMDGKVVFKEDWFNADTSSEAIGKLLAGVAQ